MKWAGPGDIFIKDRTEGKVDCHKMGADNSRIYSPSEDEEWWYNRSNHLLSGEGKEPTTTTIDIGFAIRANGVAKNGDLSVLRGMVSYPV